MPIDFTAWSDADLAATIAHHEQEPLIPDGEPRLNCWIGIDLPKTPAMVRWFDHTSTDQDEQEVRKVGDRLRKAQRELGVYLLDGMRAELKQRAERKELDELAERLGFVIHTSSINGVPITDMVIVMRGQRDEDGGRRSVFPDPANACPRNTVQECLVFLRALELTAASLASELKEARADKKRMDRLEGRGVQSIYFNDGGQMNPASMSLRAAIDIDPHL